MTDVFYKKKDFKTASLNYNQRSRSEVIPCQPASLRLESPSPIDIAKVVKILEQKNVGCLQYVSTNTHTAKNWRGKRDFPSLAQFFAKKEANVGLQCFLHRVIANPILGITKL